MPAKKLTPTQLEIVLAINALPNLIVNPNLYQDADSLSYRIDVHRGIYFNLLDAGYVVHNRHTSTAQVTAKGLELISELRKAKVEKVG